MDETVKVTGFRPLVAMTSKISARSVNAIVQAVREGYVLEEGDEAEIRVRLSDGDQTYEVGVITTADYNPSQRQGGSFLDYINSLMHDGGVIRS